MPRIQLWDAVVWSCGQILPCAIFPGFADQVFFPYPDTPCMLYYAYIGVVLGVNVGIIYGIHGGSGLYG